MREIAIWLVGMCCMSLWANPADTAKVELDSIANVPVDTIMRVTLVLRVALF